MDGADAYYGVYLSDRIIQTDVGIICLDAVIARTGKQEYRFADLPQEEAAALGLHGSPNDIVVLWRDEEDVFAPEFIASLEGKPVTDAHPSRLLDRDNVLDHAVGHMANVRRGTTPLKSGDMPLLADLHIISKSLIAKINAGLRQLSCGYTYHIALDGERILQVDMTGNHVAVLPSGRAGHEARIYDAALIKEKPVKITLSHLLGHGLRALAANPETTPEQLAEAATAMDGVGAGARRLLPLENARRRPAAPAQDETDVYTAAEVLEIVRRDRKKRAGGRVALDEEDARKKAHSMLDRMLDKKESESEAEDAEMSQFKKSLMDLCKDDEEAMDGEDEDEEEDDEEAMDEADDDEDERPRRREDGEADDEAMDEEAGGLMESELIPVGDRPKSALDRKGKGAKDGKGKAAGMDGADVLKLLRPLVAKSKDKALRAAFDATLKRVRNGVGRGPRGIRRNGAGYDAFAGGAGRHANDRAEDGLTDAERMTASFRKFHRKNFDEVKREESSSKK